jgi:magnesium-transporting ATPase (P-type)
MAALKKLSVPSVRARRDGRLQELSARGLVPGGVVQTGMATELGKIATLIQGVGDSQTPLQRRLDQVGKQLAVLGVIAAAIVMLIGALCNDASLQPDPQTGRCQAAGDPTEGALLMAAAQANLNLADLKAALPRVAEQPFDSDRKRMTTVHQLPTDTASLPPLVKSLADNEARFVALTKGAVDGLLEICDQVWVNGRRPAALAASLAQPAYRWSVGAGAGTGRRGNDETAARLAAG